MHSIMEVNKFFKTIPTKIIKVCFYNYTQMLHLKKK